MQKDTHVSIGAAALLRLRFWLAGILRLLVNNDKVSSCIFMPLWQGPAHALSAGLCFVVPVATGQREWE